MTEQNNRVLEIAFKILSVLILPILVWVNSISVDIALINKTMSDHSEELNECKGHIVKVQLNTQSLRDIKEDLVRTQEMLEEIRRILLESRAGR